MVNVSGVTGDMYKSTYDVDKDGIIDEGKIHGVMGEKWTVRSSAANINWISIAYGNGLFVAIAYSGVGNRVMTSPDGITWTIRSSAADNGWYGVTYGNGLFVAVALSGTGNRVMTSPDGITWTIRSSAADNGWISITYGNGLFVAVAYTGTGNRVMTSPDGITWTIRSSAADNNWGGVVCGNGLFVAVAYSGTGNRVMTLQHAIKINRIEGYTTTGAIVDYVDLTIENKELDSVPTEDNDGDSATYVNVGTPYTITKDDMLHKTGDIKVTLACEIKSSHSAYTTTVGYNIDGGGDVDIGTHNGEVYTAKTKTLVEAAVGEVIQFRLKSNTSIGYIQNMSIHMTHAARKDHQILGYY